MDNKSIKCVISLVSAEVSMAELNASLAVSDRMHTCLHKENGLEPQNWVHTRFQKDGVERYHLLFGA